MSGRASRSILVLSLTVPLPARRRTWQQVQVLASRGWDVTVIGPRGHGHARSMIDGVEVLGFAQPFEGSSQLGLMVEALVALISVAILVVRTMLRKRIDVVQVVNPPDWPMLLALPMRVFGSRLIYDLADYTPSLYMGKFGRSGVVLVLLRLLARLAIRNADLVITSNEIYCRLARRLRARRGKNNVLMIPSYCSRPSHRVLDRPTVPVRIGYFGVLGKQDSVDLLIEAIACMQHHNRDSFCVDIIGDGPSRKNLEQLSGQLGLDSVVKFRGFLKGAALDAVISRFDIAIIPDRPTHYTHRISMNKAFVYTAYGIAIVSTGLRQTKRLLGDAALYVESAYPKDMAAGIELLLHESTRMQQAGRVSRLAETRFCWNKEAERYAAAIEQLVATPSER